MASLQPYGEKIAPAYLTPGQYAELKRRYGPQGREWIVRRCGTWAKLKHKEERDMDFLWCINWIADEWLILKRKLDLSDEQKPLPKARDLRATYKDTSPDGALKGLELWSDTMKRLKREREKP